MTEAIGGFASIVSAYNHQMEREFSSRSLSSRGGSEVESHHMMESGFYISSNAATIMISALVIAGVVFITLLISLASMLRSCENRSKGIIEMHKTNENYHYCKIYYLHAELNRLKFNDLPEICKAVVTRYIEDGQYERDLNITMEIAENYLSDVKPAKDARDAVLIDIDGIVLSNSHSNDGLQYRFTQYDILKEAIDKKRVFVQKLYTKLRVSGWPLILLSRNTEKERNATTDILISNGYSGWSSLVMRYEDEMKMDDHEYFTKVFYSTLQKQGFRISAVISCHLDILIAPFSGSRLFKLPDPVYHAYGFAM